MPAPDGYVLVPRWAVLALVGPATIHEQGRARALLADILNREPAEEA
jgi:hypothetical protein